MYETTSSIVAEYALLRNSALEQSTVLGGGQTLQEVLLYCKVFSKVTLSELVGIVWLQNGLVSIQASLMAE